MSSSTRLGKPLLVKCTFNRKHKRISFHSARNCTYDLLRSKVEECFSLTGTSYMIAYKDDDGEITNISTDDDLSDAVDFFNDGNDDAPPPSNSSIFSGRSTGSKKITMHVEVNIEFDTHLSDTASLDEYRDDSETQFSQPFDSVRREPEDDDDVTVSSRDYIVASNLSNGRYVLENESLSQHLSSSAGFSLPDHAEEDDVIEDIVNSDTTRYGNGTAPGAERRWAENEEDELDMVEQLGHNGDAASLNFEPVSINDRHAAWLREQRTLNIRMNLGNIHRKYKERDNSSQLDSGSIDGISLEQDTRGKYYYNYRPDSSHDQENDGYNEEIRVDEREMRSRPSPMQLAWLVSQGIVPENNGHVSSMSSVSLEEYPHLPAEYESALPRNMTSPPPEVVTDCSHCGVLLETIRYVCYTCGPKDPTNAMSTENSTINHTYPPPPTQRSFYLSAPSSHTLVASSESLANSDRNRPLPPLPGGNNGVGHHSLSGYELCAECVQSYGIFHAIEGGRDSESSPMSGPSTLSYAEYQDLSKFHRSAPQKGKLRHAFREQVWESNRWIDLQQDESKIRICSMCTNATDKKRYKCVRCSDIHMCQSCYSQAHDLHPSHAFIAVSDVEVSKSFRVHPSQEEQPLLHRGVVCVHCLQDVVGARFHCPYCGVDICQNCESAGLPGNLDATDGGHDSTHIMLKIPYHLDSEKVNELSTLARHLKSDAPAIGRGFAPSLSASTSHVDISTSLGSVSLEQRDHQLFCGHCRQTIIGVRYQCVNCSSSPTSYSLCQICEERSYEVHNPNHVFFRLPRPVDRAIESPSPFLPKMYIDPAGATERSYVPDDPKAYLEDLVHRSAVCDCCVLPIKGEWFRCVYCPRDLCHDCLRIDTHDDTHFFVVFKSKVDMQIFRQNFDIDGRHAIPPIIPYTVYHKLISNL
ncbi:hypothetical protein AX15_006453 [Amanita polypyramis BW_CC]|nr:hypothetical protein AX15_006453 [Amanita polypyramis BW_CC]